VTAPTVPSLAVPAARATANTSPRGAGSVLLVGTALSVAQLDHGLKTVRPRPRVIGCVIPAVAAEQVVQRKYPLRTAVLGGLDDLPAVLEERLPDLVLVTLPLTLRGPIDAAIAALDAAGVDWRFMPTLSDQLAGRSALRLPTRTTGVSEPGSVSPDSGATDTGSLRAPSVSPVDPAGIDFAALIDRRPRPLDERSIRDAIAGKRVLITGAGGSIGSELAAVVARFDPARLILVERAENPLFQIDAEIARLTPAVDRKAVLHDVTHADRTLDLLARHRPQVIFHAAAHKHVPMMEDHPAEAVENNFFGTRAVADAADAVAAERFVMISTDKAVHPSSVMGATKRLGELYIQRLNEASATRFAMVRFGNVLGSACSVLPIWSRQLSHGGPITVTDPSMTRYFMTIPEAAGLVLQAAAYSRGGEVFLLDMGKPIRILDLARRFLRLHGYEPNVDIPIRLTGARPGEKLHEELAYTGEEMAATPHASIRRWQTAAPSRAQIDTTVAALDRLRTGDGTRQPWRDVTPAAVVTALRTLLPEMTAATAAAG